MSPWDNGGARIELTPVERIVRDALLTIEYAHRITEGARAA